ncbi:BED-type domain-containing protein [Citrus sinensis]|uniref:BED-type domain-containing protein n=1 Tax=Citrus sinensis TaxID=2711 RepID=A0ACB8NVB2_CITSI|nr:BED-type domain-containing protein [Citrus sinensis]
MEGTQKAKRKRPAIKKRSATWNHFTLLEDNPNKCKCNYCGRQYQCHSRRDGITNMRNHILACLAYKTFREQQEGSQQNLTTEGGEGNASNMVLAKGWSQDACRRAVTKMIIMGELPLSFVDNKGFRHFYSVPIPQFVMPSRRTIGRDVMDLFLEKKTMLKSLICINKQRVSLTTDLWTSVQNMSYMVITTHFIDSDCTNDVAVNYMTMQLLAWRNDDAIVLAGQYMHVRCCAHILNFIVVSGLNELHASVAAIRNAVKYVRSSTMRLQAFKQCAQQVKCPNGTVVLDCPTRWNSIYLMLMTALKFQAAFDRMPEVDKPYKAYFLEKENNAKGKINKILIVASILDPRAKMDFAKHIFEIIFANDGWKVEEMTKAVKDLLNDLYDAYSAMCSSSTPSMCSESVANGSYGGTSYSPYFTTEKVFVQNEGKRVVSKVERYLNDPVEDPSNLKLNVLLWWKEDIKEQIFYMELQEEFVRSQSSTVETVSTDMGVMDI